MCRCSDKPVEAIHSIGDGLKSRTGWLGEFEDEFKQQPLERTADFRDFCKPNQAGMRAQDSNPAVKLGQMLLGLLGIRSVYAAKAELANSGDSFLRIVSQAGLLEIKGGFASRISVRRSYQPVRIVEERRWCGVPEQFANGATNFAGVQSVLSRPRVAPA